MLALGRGFMQHLEYKGHGNPGRCYTLNRNPFISFHSDSVETQLRRRNSITISPAAKKMDLEAIQQGRNELVSTLGWLDHTERIVMQ